jgi:hypothetical protein
VEVSESSGQNGKTVTEFTSPDDYPIWAPTNPTLSSKQRYAHWAYGLLKKTTVYDAAGNPVKQTENVYDTTYARRSQCYGGVSTDKYGNFVGYWGNVSCKCLVIKTSSQKNPDWENPANYNGNFQLTSSGDMGVDISTYCSGRMELKTSYERSFNQSNPTQYAETKTDYTYYTNGNSYNYNNEYGYYNNYQLQSIKSTDPNGDVKTKTVTYTDNHHPAAANDLTKLQANGIVVPITTKTSVIKNGTNQSGLLNETVTEFATTVNGDVKPYRTLERRFKEPFYYNWSNTIDEFYGYPGYDRNPIDYKETQKLTYDANSKIVGMKDEGDRMVTNIYDHNNKYVTASVVNADASLDKCAYTSFETPNLGGWVLNGAASYITTNAVTGNSSFTLNGTNNLTAPLNTAKPYRLSFWATTASVTVTGNATLVKSAPVLNGFTYYEYAVAQGTASVAVSGNSTIDELRLYPANARMRSVTYDPLIGKTSECDENNRVTYYEYDEHGRLRFIKDDTKNIVKMYEYNLAKPKQTGPCVITYYNKTINAPVQKNNCPAGYVGSVVNYTIAANTYSSIINQAVADMQAQDELNRLGQAYANTNGSCLQLFYNTIRIDTFWKQGCPIGYKGTYILYTVPANKYSSTISQADADLKAQREAKANGQAFANKPGNAFCIIDTEADWEGTGESQCEVVNGSNTGYKLYNVRDQNPNSLTYNQTQWTTGKDIDPSCPVPPPVPCTFSITPGFTSVYNSISNTNGVVLFYLIFYSSSSIQPGQGYNIATINGGCRPTAQRTINYNTTGGRSWTITIFANGVVSVYLNPGSTPVSPNSTVGLASLTYNL